MLAKDLDARENVLRRQVRDLSKLILDQRWIGDRALDEVLADGGPISTDE